MCRTPFDQPKYKVKITIEPGNFQHETITSNIQAIMDSFNISGEIDEMLFSTISLAVLNEADLRSVLDGIGIVPSSVYFSSLNTES